MTKGWRFTLIGDPLCPMVESASLALSARGTDFDRRKARNPASLSGPALPAAALFIRDPQGQSHTITDSLIALDVIDDLYSSHTLYPADPLEKARMRDTVQWAVRAHARVDPVLTAQADNDLDIAVFFLRSLLQKLSDRLAGCPDTATSLTNADIALAPLLWRLGVLDATFNSYLLSGLEILSDHRARILSHPLCVALFTEHKREDWTREVIGKAGLLVPADRAALVGAGTAPQVLSLAPVQSRVRA